jgi:rRNA-processing protein FCF1|tara:strand:+ start:164 stop:1915 length:1752 start_codon:yes stop_codon:yes gene_type:complete
MKILKLLNKKSLSIFFVLLVIFSTNLRSEEEPVDIWDIEKKIKKNNSNEILENDDSNKTNIEIDNNNLDSSIDIIGSNLLSEKTNVVGLYDPEENGLNIDMWFNSNGNEIKLILNKINKMNLSKDSKEILDIALLTNSYFPRENITEEEFIDFKLNYLINNNNELIKLYLLKNEGTIYNSKLIKFYINSYLESADLENACEIFNEIKYFNDDYINKFIIYCLINQNNRDEAQLLFDLNKETGFNDDFFEDKFNFLMEYIENADSKISDKNILNFFLSHRTNPDFFYKPNKNTPKFIWKYLSSSNLLENIDSIDLEDSENISLIEQATHEKNYEEKELFELYKRFQFNINQLLNVKESYKLLQNYEGRALLYQRLILTKDANELLDLSLKLKQSFTKDNIGNAFNNELKEILSVIDENDVPSNYSSFYFENISTQELKKKKVKVNNKVIHQSKLLKYFEKENDINKTQEDLDKLLKSIKKNKDYVVSTKDLILLESLISDGIEIKKKYKNMFKFDQSNVPTDIQMLLNNKETGMILLRLVEIIGEDDLENLDADTLYFMTSILNELDLDLIRNKLLLEVLPLKL